MKNIKHLFAMLIVAASGYLVSGTALADLPQVKGQIRSLNTESGEIIIKHGPIPNLNMMGMTMAFQAQDGVDMSGIAEGDTVDFTVEEKDGEYIILSIVKAE